VTGYLETRFDRSDRPRGPEVTMPLPPPWWSRPTAELVAGLSTPRGLDPAEAAARLRRDGPNRVVDRAERSAWRALFAQLGNPLVLLLIVAALISLAVGEWVDAAIVLTIVFVSAGVEWWQERRAGEALGRLRARVTVLTTVERGGAALQVPAEAVVRGDVVRLSAGSLIPADGVVLEARDFFVNQASLTGETFPVEKTAAPSPADAALSARTNAVYLGTNVRSGSARMLVVETGRATVFGDIAARLATPTEETDFERGLRDFGRLLTQAMAVLVLLVFAVHLWLGRPLVDGLLFAIALAVGIAPELLPAVLLVNLSRGAERMAAAGVIVRRLAAIEDIGSMDVLCTDKTGTLTVGTVHLQDALDPEGAASPEVLRLAIVNARLQTGLENPLDLALSAQDPDGPLPEKIGEIPYDFLRKRLTVVVRREDGAAELITKGALESVLSVCAFIDSPTGFVRLDEAGRAALHARLVDWSAEGSRVLGVARGTVKDRGRYSRADEADLIFMGFLRFEDPLKEGGARGHRRPRRAGGRPEGHHRRQPIRRRAPPKGPVPARGPGAHRSRPPPDVRRGPRPPRRGHAGLRRGRSQSEGAHHPRPPAAQPRRGLPRRRHQRRAGPARRRRGPLGRGGGRRGQGGRRLRPPVA
jgi:Mg2+-importing ATPase